MSSGITRDDWLKALAEVGVEDVDDRDAITRKEFAAMTGLNIQAAVRRLEAMVRAGKARRTSKREADNMGRVKTTIAYRLTEKKRR